VLVAGDSQRRWIEAVWAQPGGPTYAWYHTEPDTICPGQRLTAPEIGAMVSNDGVNFTDLGIVLSSGYPPNCGTANLYFAGGHGDFSVVPDRTGTYLYFVFTNYGGPVTEQGVAIARMAIADAAYPAGNVWKFSGSTWTEPGLGGHVTPVFAAKSGWASPAPDSYWGPSLHWNTALGQYVALFSHVAGNPDWTNEGVYVAFTPDLSDPHAWTEPTLLLGPGAWYPQVYGDQPGESDSVAGATVRLYMMGHSEWQLVFARGQAQVSNLVPSEATTANPRMRRKQTVSRRHPL
jgi:hypothetical protein